MSAKCHVFFSLMSAAQVWVSHTMFNVEISKANVLWFYIESHTRTLAQAQPHTMPSVLSRTPFDIHINVMYTTILPNNTRQAILYCHKTSTLAAMLSALHTVLLSRWLFTVLIDFSAANDQHSNRHHVIYHGDSEAWRCVSLYLTIER